MKQMNNKSVLAITSALAEVKGVLLTEYNEAEVMEKFEQDGDRKRAIKDIQSLEEKSPGTRSGGGFRDFCPFYRCTLRSLFFCQGANISHFFYWNNLFGGTKPKCLMERIGDFRSGIDRLISFAFIFHEIHFL